MSLKSVILIFQEIPYVPIYYQIQDTITFTFKGFTILYYFLYSFSWSFCSFAEPDVYKEVKQKLEMGSVKFEVMFAVYYVKFDSECIFLIFHIVVIPIYYIIPF